MQKTQVALAALGGLIATLVTASPAQAQAQCGPTCDSFNPDCWKCDDGEQVTGWEVGDEADTPVKAEFGRSPGSDRGGALWIAIKDTMQHVPIATPSRTASFDADRRQHVVDQNIAGPPLARAAEGRAVGDNVFVRWATSVGGGATVPLPQGVVRDTGPDGTARSADRDGQLADPIDPITGELIVEHLDLALPSFGVSFSHRRIYRSRMDYDGPLGPGWDFTYNQRLFEAPHVAPDPPPAGEPDRLPIAEMPAGEIGEAGPDCGPVLVLTSGDGTVLRFREASVANHEITYSGGPPELTLRGHVDGDVTTWTLTARAGDVRRFDEAGRLVGWVDANGVGLALQWEPGSGPRDWRIARVVDSVGRQIVFTYDGADRITRVTEPASGLFAAYEYGANGGLVHATRGDGRSETYQYDVQSGRERGDWIPERILEAACTASCSPSSASCDSGGACDAAIADATAACIDSCPDCYSECSGACGGLCTNACRDGAGGCESTCEGICEDGDHVEAMRDNCLEFYDTSGADDICEDCRLDCDALGTGQCAMLFSCFLVSEDGSMTVVSTEERCVDLASLGDFFEDLGRGIYALFAGVGQSLWCLVKQLWGGECDWDSWWNNLDELCDDDADTCCTSGNDCSRLSCNRGVACEDACGGTFLGFGGGGRCPAPVLRPGCEDFILDGPPSPSDPDYQDFLECTGTAAEWASELGCLPTSQKQCAEGCTGTCTASCREPCVDSCENTCFVECRVPDCVSYCVGLDLPGTCVDACTDACVTDLHTRGPVPGPKYGYTADLQFNLIKIFDGNGDLYLENTYEQDIASPNFDTVISQRYGEHAADMQHVDLAYGDHTTAWAAGLVEAPADYDAPTICHYGCEAVPPDPRDVAVPWNDLILVFGAGSDGEFSAGGWSADSSLDDVERALEPVFISVDATHGARIAPRAVSSALEGTETSVQLDTPAGKVYLQITASGEGAMEGAPAAITELMAAGGVTLFGDGVMLRAYPGVPRAVLAVADGRCTQPFHLRRSSIDRVTVEPADACSDSLWLAPVAGPAIGLDATEFQTSGQAAITRSYFTPSTLAPSRAPVILSRHDGDEYALAAAPSASAVDFALEMSKRLYASAPLFTVPNPAPPMVPAADEVVYVFHQDTEAKPGSYPPSLPPTDEPWSIDDLPDTVYQPPCDPTVPGPAYWGNGLTGPGAKPAHATAIRDLHGARWTFYADDRGRLLRVVNHETGSSRWAEYDPDGRITGTMAPDGARQCMRYDVRGNLAEVLSLAAPVAGVTTPAPIRQRFGWTDSPVRLQSIVDPRDLTRLFQRREYDTSGNLRAIVAIDGSRTELTLVGGSGPSRAMPKRMVGPDGAVTLVTYDVGNGTVRSVTRDASGASPVASEVQADVAGRPTWMLSPLGLIETFEWDGPLLVERSWDADGLVRTESYAHDDDTQLTLVTRGRQQVSLRYDTTGALFATTQSAIDSSLPPANRCQKTGPNGRVLEEVSAEGDRVRYTHDGEGRVTSVVAGNLGPAAGTWDDTCLAQSTGQSVSGPVASYQYDTSGRPVRMTDGRGLLTTWTYDGFGRPIIERRPDGGKTHTGYDAVGQVSWLAAYSFGGGNNHVKPMPGQAGLLAMAEVSYDLRGRVERVDRWHFDAQGTAIGDGLSRTYYAYDEVARTVTVTDDVGRVTRSRLDGAGRGVEVILPDGSAINTAYLDGGRTVRSSRTGIGGAVVGYTTLTATGQIAESSIVAGGTTRSLGTTSWIDPFLPGVSSSASGATATLAYDAFDRVTATSTAVPGGFGEQVEVVFDRDGRPVSRSSVAVPGQPAAKWTFAYDAIGRQVRETDPAGATTVTEYIGATGLPLATTDPRQIRTTMTYADGGWLQTASVDAPAAGTDITLSFNHDALGRMLSATRQDGAQIPVRNQFTWDSLGNLISESDDVIGDPARRTHVHDGAGQRRSTTFGGHTATRTFDTLGRQTTLVLDGASPAAATWTYDAPGGPKVRRLANGVETRYGYDKLSRLTSASDWRGTSMLATNQWQLPLDGVPRQLTAQRQSLPDQSSVFAIDGLGRLTAEQSGISANLSLDALDPVAPATASALAAMTNGRSSYDLDGRNNWLSRKIAAATTTYQRDARDALTAVGATAITTDATGAITNNGTSFSYDALGLLSEVRPPTGSGRLYRRDALGRVVSETDTISGAVTRHAYDGAQRVASASATGALTLHFAAEGLDAPVVTLSGGARTYYHQDRQGSVYALTDSAGNPTRWLSYTAYGEATLHDGAGQLLPPTSSLNTFGYHGLPHDFALGLVDMRARAYAPSLGRFLSPDPIALAGGSNLFAFVDSGPLAWRDPFGLAKKAAMAVANFPREAERHLYGAFGITDDMLTPGAPSLAWEYTFGRNTTLNAAADADYGAAADRFAQGAFQFGLDLREAQQYNDEQRLLLFRSLLTDPVNTIYEADKAIIQTPERIATDPEQFLKDTFCTPNCTQILIMGAEAAATSEFSLTSSLAQRSVRGRIIRHIVDDLGESLDDYEYFLHGTTAEKAATFTLDEGKPLYTTVDPAVARHFAERTIAKAGRGEVGGIAVVLPRSVVKQLKDLKVLHIGPIDDMPGVLQWVFAPGARSTILDEGIIIKLPDGAL